MRWYKTEKGFKASVDLEISTRLYEITECDTVTDRNVLLSINRNPKYWFYNVEDTKLFVELLEEGKR